MQVGGKRDGVPVSWFSPKKRYFKFANWPNSSGMGPGVKKNQSDHTANWSPYPTARKGHMERKSLPSNRTHVKREKRCGVPVSLLIFNHSSRKFANLPNSVGIGPGVYKNQSDHTAN
jgi:hypothetical protein